jgi:hypothetical protein
MIAQKRGWVNYGDAPGIALHSHFAPGVVVAIIHLAPLTAGRGLPGAKIRPHNPLVLSHEQK